MCHLFVWYVHFFYFKSILCCWVIPLRGNKYGIISACIQTCQSYIRCAPVVTSITDTTVCVVCHPPVSAEQKLQPLCCYLLPAGGAAQGPSLQLPRRTAARRPPATTQHHRRTDCGQGNCGVTSWFAEISIHSSLIKAPLFTPAPRNKQKDTTHSFINPAWFCLHLLFSYPALILMHLPQLHYSFVSFFCLFLCSFSFISSTVQDLAFVSRLDYKVKFTAAQFSLNCFIIKDFVQYWLWIRQTFLM